MYMVVTIDEYDGNEVHTTYKVIQKISMMLSLIIDYVITLQSCYPLIIFIVTVRGI